MEETTVMQPFKVKSAASCGAQVPAVPCKRSRRQPLQRESHLATSWQRCAGHHSGIPRSHAPVLKPRLLLGVFSAHQPTVGFHL